MPRYSPLINGKNYDWGNITFVLYGTPVIGITEINYDRSRESPNNYGAGYEPVSYGNKNFTYAGDISIYFDELNAIVNSPTTPNRSILEIPPDTIIVQFEGDGVPLTVHRLKNVRFLKDPFGSKQNDSNIIVKIPFAFAGKYN